MTMALTPWGLGLAGLGAAAALFRLWQRRDRPYQDSASVARAYDRWTEDALLENLWGEHVHLGHYGSPPGPRDFRAAKEDLVHALVRWSHLDALPPGSRVLVVDLGGGTIDLSLVQLQGGEGKAAPIAQLLRFAGRELDAGGQALRCARVLGKAGLALGGRDLDRWIAAELCPGVRLDGELLRTAEALKCRLSTAEEAVRLWAPSGQPPRELRLSRRRFEELLMERGLLEQLDTLLEEVRAGARREELGETRIDAVLPVGGSSRIPLIRRWIEERCPGLPLRGERPIEAVALGALALTPGVRVRDVLARGVSLRCWDRRSANHRWHPLFVAGQAWPTAEPLELVLACSRDGQEALELVPGEPVGEQRSEVVFRDGLPVLRRRPAGEGMVEPWGQPPTPIPRGHPGRPASIG